MALSPSTGFIRPEVYAAAVQASVNGQLVLKQFATVYPEMEGNPGEVLNLVAFSRLTSLSADTDETATLVPETITSAETSLTIREASKAAEITWRAARTAFGDPVAAARDETVRVIATRVDDVLRSAAETAASSRTLTVARAITYADVIDATSPFGDAVINGGVGIVVHSQQWRSLMKTAEFQRATRGGGSTAPGYVGTLGDVIPVYVSDRITVIDGDTDPDTYRALLFFGQPLAYAHKRDIEVNTADDILKRTTVASSTLFFAGGVLRAERIAALVTQ